MMRPAAPRELTLACLLLLAAAPAMAAPSAPPDSNVTARDSLAARPDSLVPPHEHRTPPRRHVSDPADSTRILPRWLRPWLEFGGGWMAGPSWLKPNYQSSQGFGAGLEARPYSRWALRAGADYQMLQATHNGQIVIGTVGPGGSVFADTMAIHFATSAWVLSLHGETGVRPLGDLWLTGGGGFGYFRTGFDDYYSLDSPDLLLQVPVAMRSGLGWDWTAAVRYDFEPAPEAPLGFEVRMTSLRRGKDDVQVWSMRLCYRVPDLPKSHEHGPRDGGRHGRR